MLTSKAISIKSLHALILEIWRCQNLWDLFRASLMKANDEKVKARNQGLHEN
jgi:hypothetical protein